MTAIPTNNTEVNEHQDWWYQIDRLQLIDCLESRYNRVANVAVVDSGYERFRGYLIYFLLKLQAQQQPTAPVTEDLWKLETFWDKRNSSHLILECRETTVFEAEMMK